MMLHYPVHRLLCFLPLSEVLLLGVLLAVSDAQVPSSIIPDGTLGTVVTPDGRVFSITGGTRPDQGPNLFHSFDQFDVGTGDTAHFMGQPGIDNIISRVTGGSASHIDGRLQSDANLFLLNPSGLMLGPNATLNVNGSFHASTADVLRFADGATFSAHLNEKSTLTVAAPEAFGFLSENPAGIAVQGSILEVPPGKALSVVGGDIAIAGGTLRAPGGWVSITSVASPGEVIPDTLGQPPELNVQAFEHLGAVALSQGALIDASDGSGTVVIRGGRLTIDTARISVDTSGSVPRTSSKIDIQVAEGIMLTNGALITADVFGPGGAEPNSIVIAAKDVAIVDGARISSSTVGAGRGGMVTIRAADAVTVSGASRDGALVSAIGAITLGSGDAGDIVVEARTVTLTDGARIVSDTSGTGRGGMVTVRAADAVIVSGTDRNITSPSAISAATSGNGDSGQVVVEAQDVTVTSGAQIASGTFGSGQGGAVTVKATSTVALAGTTSDGKFPSIITTNAEGRIAQAGTAGSVVVEAKDITVTGGAAISSSTTGAGRGGMVVVRAAGAVTMSGTSSDSSFVSGIGAVTQGGGDAGDIMVEARNIILTDGAQITGSTFNAGHGGAVTVRVTDAVLLLGTDKNNIPSAIGAVSQGTGDAGTVFIESKSVTLTDGARIASGTLGPGQGGTVTVRATDAIRVSGVSRDGAFPSLIDALTRGAGHAGAVLVEAKDVLLTNGGQISSSTFGAGYGGTVTVRATNSVTLSGTDRESIFPSGIGAVSQGIGDAGAVLIEAKDVTVTDGAQIASSAFGAGDGGTVTVTSTETLTLSGQQSGLRTNVLGSGKGGNIAVHARHVQLTEDAIISTESSGAGNAGSITITAMETFLSENSTVTTKARNTDGGDIQLTAQAVVRLQDSQITTAVGTGMGAGGNITIDTIDSEFVILANSQITADAFGGPGGNIDIPAEVFLAGPTSQVTASSERNIDGVINIRSLVTDISDPIAPPPVTFVNATTLLRDRCAARLQEGQLSSLVVSGRISVPATPEGLLPSRFYQPSPMFSLLPEIERQPAETTGAPLGRSQIIHGPFLAHVPLALKCNWTPP